jgi:hypothetical protein
MRWYGYGIQGHGPTVVGDVEAWGHTGGTGGYGTDPKKLNT